LKQRLDPGTHQVSTLTALRMDYCYHLTDAGVFSLCSLPRLTLLDLGSCPKLTDAAAHTIVSLTTLRTLRLAHCAKLTDAAAAAVSSLPVLEHLDLRSCRRLTTALVLQRATSLLTTLHLASTAVAHISALSELKELRELDLAGCSQLTDDDVLSLCVLALTALDLTRCVWSQLLRRLAGVDWSNAAFWKPDPVVFVSAFHFKQTPDLGLSGIRASCGLLQVQRGDGRGGASTGRHPHAAHAAAVVLRARVERRHGLSVRPVQPHRPAPGVLHETVRRRGALRGAHGRRDGAGPAGLHAAD
jgi:hypothetical protein